MPPTARANIIKLKNSWCMKCLRTSINNWDTGDTSEPFSIQCFLNVASSKKCQQCIARHSYCDRPSEGMWGDAHDLVSILEWAAWVYSVDNGYYAQDTDYLETVNEGVLQFLKDFVAAHQAHNSSHGISGSHKKDESQVRSEVSLSIRPRFANVW